MTIPVLIHVAIGLLGIASGLVVLYGLLARRWPAGWNALFLATTVLTSVTGFGLPADRLLPSHVVGIVSMVVLAVALFALYARRMSARWRLTYVATATIALYLNVFVLVVQLFLKVPGLKALAPTQSEPPFVMAQAIVLVLFAALGTAAALRFRAVSLTGAMPGG